MVEPYVFRYHMRCKERWLGKRVEDIFLKEFKQNPGSYYREALRDGRIRVNGMADAGDHLLHDRDEIQHITHRHEPPVDGRSIQIVAEDDDVLAVDKPASVPMHPCGSYHYNTLSSLLRYEVGRKETLKQVHRLDRLTSGLVLFAKTKIAARRLSETIGSGDAKKLYLARVSGRFPLRAPRAKKKEEVCKIDWLPTEKHHAKESDVATSARVNDDSWRQVSSMNFNDIEVDLALSCLNHKDGIYACTPLSLDPTARPSRTRFRLLYYNETDDTSLLACEPKTGRTHQIRLHLQYLCHPIANDPCYGGHLTQENMFPAAPPSCSRPDEPQPNLSDIFIRRPGESDAALAIRCCRRCRFRLPQENQPHAKFIWLHALRYSGPGWSYCTPAPDWAFLGDPSQAEAALPSWWNKLPLSNSASNISQEKNNNHITPHASSPSVYITNEQQQVSEQAPFSQHKRPRHHITENNRKCGLM